MVALLQVNSLKQLFPLQTRFHPITLRSRRKILLENCSLPHLAPVDGPLPALPDRVRYEYGIENYLSRGRKTNGHINKKTITWPTQQRSLSYHPQKGERPPRLIK